MSTTSDLNPAEYNPRKITDDELLRLKRQLKEFGDLGGVVFNIRTGRLVSGHQRITALDGAWPIQKEDRIDDSGTVAAGFIDTPFGRFGYREVDWDEAREKLANLAANNNAGHFDDRKLGDVLLSLKDMPLAELSGFETPVLDKFLLPSSPPEIKEWDLTDIEEPFWIVIRGPVRQFHQVRDILRSIETEGVVVEASL